MRVDRLRRLIEFIRQLPDKSFRFADWVQEFDQEHQCGTVCCAAGWLPRVDLEHWTWPASTNKVPELISDPSADVDEDLEEYFGIDWDLVDALFYPGSLSGDATPAEWADHAEAIVKEYEDAN